jgi:pantoate--beta-alanine ligase
MAEMRTITSIEQMGQECRHYQGRIGFVPTMGYLHEGHLSLVKQARTENDLLIVSIFVNPTQFAPQEDLESYPKDLRKDLELLEEAGVDFVFTPTDEEMYPQDFASYVDITNSLALEVEGAHRPGHFRGVATIVLKLFQIVQPQRAYFGQKDAQQAAIITRMVNDFNLPIELSIQPIIRDANGLAMSSRNSYLTTKERDAANILYQALQAGKKAFEHNFAGNPEIVKRAMRDILLKEPQVQLIYVELRDPTNFQALESLRGPALLLIAAQIGLTRLIDNFLLKADGSWETGSILSGTPYQPGTRQESNYAR